MKLKVLVMLGYLGATAASCGIEIPQAEQNIGELDSTESSENDGYLLGDDVEVADSEYNANERVLSEEAKAVIEAIRSLDKVQRLTVADCAGFGDEVRAFEVKKTELKESGMSRSDIRTALSEDHIALRELMKSKRDAIKTCKEGSKDSESALAIREIVQACWSLPEGAESYFGQKRLHKKGRHEKRRGRKNAHGLKLPPRFLADFSSVECTEAI